MKRIYFLAFLFSATASYSQTVIAEHKGFDWRIVPSASNQLAGSGSPFKESFGDFEASKIYTDNNEVITIVAFDKDRYGVIRINSAMKVKWSTQIEGVPQKIAKFNGHIIVITNDISKKVSNSLTAILLDKDKGKVILKKNIHPGQARYAEESKYFISSDGQFNAIGVRETLRENGTGVSFFGIGMSKMGAEYRNTKSFKVLTVDEKLGTSSTPFTVKWTGTFDNCVNDSEGNIYVSSHTEGLFVVTMFDRQGNKKLHITCPLDARKNTSFSTELLASSKPGIVYLAATYTNEEKDKAFSLYAIDFINNKKKLHRTVFDKKLKKEYRDSYVEVNKKLDKLHTDNWDDMEVLRIEESDGKIVVWNECLSIITRVYNGHDRMKWLNTDAVLLVFSENLEKLSTVVIPKRLEIELGIGIYSAFHIKGEHLYYVSANLRPLQFSAITGKYNLLSKKMISLDIVDKKNISNLNPADPKASLWFDDGYVIPYLAFQGFLKVNEIKTDLQKLGY